MSYSISEIRAACKSNNIDPKELLLTLKANKQKKESRPFWDCFLKTWEEFNLQERGQKYLITGRDIPNLAELYDLIKKRCDIACYEWNEDCVCRSFSALLKRAMSHSEFIKKDFRPLHLVNQFNSIVSNVTGNTKAVNGDYKRELLDRIGANSG